MRYVLTFSLKKAEISLEYRKMFLSYIKRAVTEYSDGEYFAELFGDTKVKRYCFSAKLPRFVLENAAFQLDGQTIEFSVSTMDSKTGIVLYNALCGQKYKSFPLEYSNEMILQSIRPVPEKIISGNRVIGKTTMPLCIRYHDAESNKDQYFTFQDENFREMVHMVVSNHVKTVLQVGDSILEGFAIIPKAMKKTITRHYGMMIPVSLGVFEMTGNPVLLNYLYLEGVGSRRSAGFGTWEILGEK